MSAIISLELLLTGQSLAQKAFSWRLPRPCLFYKHSLAGIPYKEKSNIREQLSVFTVYQQLKEKGKGVAST